MKENGKEAEVRNRSEGRQGGFQGSPGDREVKASGRTEYGVAPDYDSRENHDPTTDVKTFRELYCERHGLPAERFEDALTALAWYPHTRLVRWLMQVAHPKYLEPDREFVRAVGDLRTRRLFSNEAANFHHERANHWFIRRVLKARVSAERIRRVFDEVMGARDSQPPV
jgi:hypothetical protein